jgi:hypothetical protein
MLLNLLILILVDYQAMMEIIIKKMSKKTMMKSLKMILKMFKRMMMEKYQMNKSYSWKNTMILMNKILLKK